MKFEEIRIGDKVQMIGQPNTKGLVVSKQRVVSENDEGVTIKETVNVQYEKQRNTSYSISVDRIEPALVEPDYSVFKREYETSEQFAERQYSIRKNYHKVRPGESWPEYENRTGLPAPVISGREQHLEWTDKVIKSIGECTVNAIRNVWPLRMPHESLSEWGQRVGMVAASICTDRPRPNTSRSCLG